MAIDPASLVPARRTEPKRRRDASAHRLTDIAEGVFRRVCQAAAFLVIAIALALVIVLVWKAWHAIETIGIRFFTSSTWDPEPTHREFGALAFIYGTIVTSIIAMSFAVPFGVGTAAFLSEIAPLWLRRSGSFFVEMLAAIPSVVYGFWGLYVFAPVLQRVIAAAGGPEQAGIGLLSAGLVLGIMIVPYTAAVSFDVIRSVPRSQREGALALGATRWQTIWRVVLPYARPGIIGGCFLSLGRALGETMAVTMLIGNRAEIVFSIFAKGNSIPSVIANEFTEATYDLYLSALVALGLVLLLVSVGFSALGRILIWRVNQRRSGSPRRPRRTQANMNGRQDETLLAGHESRRSGVSGPARVLARKKANFVDWLMTGAGPGSIKRGFLTLALIGTLVIATSLFVNHALLEKTVFPALALAAVVTVIATMGVLGLLHAVTIVPLFLIVGYLLYHGATALSWDFFTKLPAPVGQRGGGMANALYGSALMVGLATAFSVPVALLTAIYLAEYRTRLGAIVRFIAEMLASVPSIVIGIFGYYAVVRPITNNFSALAGGFALGVMMLPIVIRASEEAINIVPVSLRHSSYALGASRWQTIARVSVPAALPAIITAVFLGIARVAGETAPLLLTASSNAYWPRSLNDYTPSLPVFIFNYAVSPYQDWHRQAWAAAFVLVTVVMILNIGVRLVAGKRVILAAQAG